METSSDPAGGKKINWRQFGRHWIVVFILAVLAAFVIWGMLKSGPWLREWQNRRAASAFKKQMEELYRNDKYGGKTPEETFDMFIAALEKGDVELASKYFVLDKQEGWRQSLIAIKKQPSAYGEMLAEMRFARDNSRKDIGTNFVWLIYKLGPDNLGEDIVFEKILERWKISDL